MNQTTTGEFLYKFATMTNAEAYVEVFHNRLMKPLPDTGRTGEYWGSSSRADFYPYLKEAISELRSKPIKLLDVGAGSGEMIDHVLKDYAALISIVEPNLLMLKSYMQALRRHAKLKATDVCSLPIQSMYGENFKEIWLKSLPKQDFILASHMIYGLTNTERDVMINPSEDLLNFLTAMYEKLAEGGTLFVVYAAGENTLLGEAAAHHLRYLGGSREQNVRNTWAARTNLLENAGVKDLIDTRFPQYCANVSTRRVNSYVYGEDLQDIAAYCSLGELTQIDGQSFDIRKLQHSINFIKKHGENYNLQQIIGSKRDGMLKVPTPQVICKIRKCKLQQI